jgi:Ser-tRNA(Ala) deacylase AlaX
MIKYLYYKKDTGKLSMIADGEIGIDKNKFDLLKKDITEQKIKEIKEGQETHIKNKIIEIIPREKPKEDKIKDIKDKLNNPNLSQKDLKETMLDVIDNLI